MRAWGCTFALLIGAGLAHGEEPVAITPANLKDKHREHDVVIAGQLVGMLPNRPVNKWVFIIRVDGTAGAKPGEAKGAADIFVEMKSEGDDRQLVQRWSEYQARYREAAAQRKNAPVPPTVKITGEGRRFGEGVGFHALPSMPGESPLKATLTEAVLGR